MSSSIRAAAERSEIEKIVGTSVLDDQKVASLAGVSENLRGTPVVVAHLHKLEIVGLALAPLHKDFGQESQSMAVIQGCECRVDVGEAWVLTRKQCEWRVFLKLQLFFLTQGFVGWAVFPSVFPCEGCVEVADTIQTNARLYQFSGKSSGLGSLAGTRTRLVEQTERTIPKKFENQ